MVSRINTRIQDLTGLDVSTAEELQVSDSMALLLGASHQFQHLTSSGWVACACSGRVATKIYLQRGKKVVFAEQLFNGKWLFWG